MQVITSITSQPKQTFNIRFENNEVVVITMYYYASQHAWFFDFQYGDYECNGNKVVLSINTLRHLRNILPFGLGFISGTNADPFDLESFSNGDCMMIAWDKDEVQALEDEIYNVA